MSSGCYLNPDMFYYAINSMTSYPSLHPAIQDPGFTSSQCLQARVEEKTNNPSVSLCTICLSRCFKSQIALIFNGLQIPLHFLVDCDELKCCIDCPLKTGRQTGNSTFVKIIFYYYYWFIFAMHQTLSISNIKYWAVAMAPMTICKK